jgi:G3E family GTPase
MNLTRAALSMVTMSCLTMRVVRSFSPRVISQAIRVSNSGAMASYSSRPSLGSLTDRHYIGFQYKKSDSKSLLKRFSSISDSDQKVDERPPITLLAGFLGSGKTTTLQNMLTNSDGIKIGIIVNDVASINIDSKLLSNPFFSKEETIELQNGCACCSLADELLTSVERLIDGGKRKFDHIVVELSGVADPVAVKNNWEQAEYLDHPATALARMDKVVTLVDSSTFGTDWMTWDTSGDRDGWVDENDDCAKEKKVPELLAEQIEAADVLLLNKIDIAGDEQVKVASALVKVLNDKAKMFEVKFGGVTAKDVFAVKALEKKKEEEDCSDPQCNDPTHDHAHSHEHGEMCQDAACTDTSHSHSHDHAEDCKDAACTDTSHSHSHDHAEDCKDAACTDTSHSHSHDHGAECTHPSHSHSHDHGEGCNDSKCTDPTHDHSHTHDHASTSTANLGISNFVYKSDRPFNPRRLLTLLHFWPVPIKEELDLGQLQEAVDEGVDINGRTEKSPFIGVLRSKGFCWMAPSVWSGPGDDVWRHNTAMYWSHAGKHFGISTAGKWWGTLNKEQMKLYFASNQKEYDRIIREDFVSEEFGDRRQEIVFIGANISEEDITKALDDCLCTDEEMESYRQQLRNFEETTFNSRIVPGGVSLENPIKAVSPDTSEGGPSLFDMGGVDHMDDVNIRGD